MIERDAVEVSDQRSGASRQVMDRRFRGREVVDPYKKDTMIARTGQPGLPRRPESQGGFSLHSSRLDRLNLSSVRIVNMGRRFHASMRWLKFYEKADEFVRGMNRTVVQSPPGHIAYRKRAR
jgi:hypothetical protein